MPKRKDLKKILVVGAGPIIIGQACEFDYSGAQACKSLREEGYKIILVNSNPATIMTDPDLSDKNLKSSMCVFHQRFSTNTLPQWKLAQPFRYLAHNGEINTIKVNINWMRNNEQDMNNKFFKNSIIIKF